MGHVLFIHSPTDGHLGHFHLLAAVNIGIEVSLQVPALNSLGCGPKSGIAASYGDSMFNILRKHRTVFHCDRTILHAHQQVFRSLHILTNTRYFPFYLSVFYSSRPNRCKVVPHRSFDLHFSND